ncbi:MAG TPA: DinB family protein [Bryobacteraceae bacterium]|nr:DinB family protein [Bryobacteraceae bacterium]
MRRRDAVFMGLAMAGSAAAQKTGCASYFAAGLKVRWKASKDYTLAMLAKMPDEHLSFRPTPEVWTFSQQLTHLADANLLMSAPLRGDKAVYVGDPRQLGRAELEKHIRDSYDYVTVAFDRLKSDADGETMVKFFDEPIPKRELCYRLLDHAAHHRAQALVYLRLKGIVPPPYAG